MRIVLNSEELYKIQRKMYKREKVSVKDRRCPLNNNILIRKDGTCKYYIDCLIKFRGKLPEGCNAIGVTGENELLHKQFDYVILKRIENSPTRYSVVLIGRIGRLLKREEFNYPRLAPKLPISKSLLKVTEYLKLGDSIIDVLTDMSRKYSDEESLSIIKKMIKNIVANRRLFLKLVNEKIRKG